jgi:hypothetical protein
MENFERLSNKIINITCPCGIVFKTYDPKKVYHSNNCGASYVTKRLVKRKRTKQKKLAEKASE